MFIARKIESGNRGVEPGFSAPNTVGSVRPHSQMTIGSLRSRSELLICVAADSLLSDFQGILTGSGVVLIRTDLHVVIRIGQASEGVLYVRSRIRGLG